MITTQVMEDNIRELLAFIQTMPAENRLPYLKSCPQLEQTHCKTLVDRLDYIFAGSPHDQHYAIYQCLTEAVSGLHLFFNYNARVFFLTFLKRIPPAQRVAELLRVNEQQVPFIMRCINPDHAIDDRAGVFLNIIISTLSQAEIAGLFSQYGMMGDFNISVFSYALHNRVLIQRLTKVLSAEQLFQLCTQPHSVSASPEPALIIAAVQVGWERYPTVQTSFQIILQALSYRMRKHLIGFEDACGSTLYSINGEFTDYSALINDAVSPMIAIETTLARYLALANDFEKIKLTSYFSLRNRLEALELKAVLEQLMNDESSEKGFIDVFSEKLLSCLSEHYQNSDEKHISFYHQTMTLTHSLYYELLMILTDITNLSDLIDMFMAEARTEWKQVVFNFPEVFPAGLNYQQRMVFFRQSEPQGVELHALTSFTTMPASLAALASCVFSSTEGVLIDLNTIKYFSFQRQRYVYRWLHANFPALAERVYQHNEAWELLAEDIQQVEKAGLSPKEALTRLIKGLQRGGENFTGKSLTAVDSAFDATAQFIAFYYPLPEDLKNNLAMLKTNNGKFSFGDIFDKMNKWVCVEQLSEFIAELVTDNAYDSSLTTPVGLTPAYFTALEKKCRHGLDCLQSDYIHHANFPSGLMMRLAREINGHDIDSLFDEFRDYPLEMLPYFWLGCHIRHETDFMDLVFRAIKNGLFPPRRENSILSSIVEMLEVFMPETLDSIFSYFVGRIFLEISDEKPILPFLSSEQLIKVLSLNSTKEAGHSRPLIYEIMMLKPETLMLLITRLSDETQMIDLLKTEFTVHECSLPIFFHLAIVWTGHFDQLQQRLKHDEQFQSSQAIIQALFSNEYIEITIRGIASLHHGGTFLSLELFEHIVKQWTQEATLDAVLPARRNLMI